IAAAVGVSDETVRRIRQQRGALALRAEVPFGGGPTLPSGNVPLPTYAADPPSPPPRPLIFDPDYPGHTVQALRAPLAVEGWTIERIRDAIATHDQGVFIESSLLAIVASRFGPVYAALGQSVAPALALPDLSHDSRKIGLRIGRTHR